MTTETKRSEAQHTCNDCWLDCTMGTPEGPPYVAIDGVTRCRRCHLIAVEKRAHLNDAAPDLLNALRGALVAGPGWRDAARAAIAKAEGK